MKRLNLRGFTIIELLIATVCFSVILLILTAAVIQFNRLYYKGTIDTKTKEVARTIVEDISRNIQFGGNGAIVGAGGSPAQRVICAGDYRYVYKLNNETGLANKHSLVRDKPATVCSATSGYNVDTTFPSAPQQPIELLGANMQLLEISVSPTSPHTIKLKIAYGDDADMNNPNTASATCKAIRLGGQFCSISGLTTIVTRRL